MYMELDDVKIDAELLSKQIKRCNNIYSMILGTLDCRLEADAGPSTGFGPAQLSPPPSSLVSLFSTFSQSSTTVDSIIAHTKFCLLLLGFFY
jgi:hypothetical protein